MQETVRSNIIRLLKECITAINKGDSFRLKELSNSNIHNASIFQDEDSLSIGVVIYALSKVIERMYNKKIVVASLRSASDALSSGNDSKYRSVIGDLIKSVQTEDLRLKKFVFSAIEQAQVKKGSVLYEHGLSISRVAAILGISKWELLNYVGKTKIAEQSSELIPTEKRLILARRLFQ
ncbi:hypothetical protein J4470_03585 [Candidatus Woesearchaeota archaeon]|nr:hypothetical protein [Candidatus Woesearchaeota archaeon]